jgi:hypothetical protein
VTRVQQRTRHSRIKTDPAARGPGATPEGASVSSDRRAQDRSKANPDEVVQTPPTEGEDRLIPFLASPVAEDLARISPLADAHVIPNGTYLLDRSRRGRIVPDLLP